VGWVIGRPPHTQQRDEIIQHRCLFVSQRFDLVGFVTEEGLGAVLLAQQVDAVVVGDGRDPLPERAIRFLLAEVFVRSHECFLGRIFCQLVGIQQSTAQPDHSDVVLSVEDLEGCVARRLQIPAVQRVIRR